MGKEDKREQSEKAEEEHRVIKHVYEDVMVKPVTSHVTLKINKKNYSTKLSSPGLFHFAFPAGSVCACCFPSSPAFAVPTDEIPHSHPNGLHCVRHLANISICSFLRTYETYEAECCPPPFICLL